MSDADDSARRRDLTQPRDSQDEGEAPPLEPLGEDEARLYYVRADAAREPALLSAYAALMSPEEEARCARYVFERDRHLHLLARALLRTTLSLHCGGDPRAWRFRDNQFGRPELADAPGPGGAALQPVSHRGPGGAAGGARARGRRGR